MEKWGPQGLVLGVDLFNQFVNDLEGVHSEFSKFTDDTTYFWVVRCHVTGMNCMKTAQDYMSSEKWQKNFIMGKCKVMHLGEMMYFPSNQVNSRIYVHMKHRKRNC